MITEHLKTEEELAARPTPPVPVSAVFRNGLEGAIVGTCLGPAIPFLFDWFVPSLERVIVWSMLGLFTGAVVGSIGARLSWSRRKKRPTWHHVPVLITVGIAILSVFWVLRSPDFTIAAILGALAFWPVFEALVRWLASFLKPPQESSEE